MMDTRGWQGQKTQTRTPGCSAATKCELRVYEAQREALIGFEDSDRGIRAEEIRAMARRWGIPDVVLDIDPTAPSGQAFAFPGLQFLRFHPVAMVRWIAAHEVAHLIGGPMSDSEAPHGPVFERDLLKVIKAECGRAAALRLRIALGNMAQISETKLAIER